MKVATQCVPFPTPSSRLIIQQPVRCTCSGESLAKIPLKSGIFKYFTQSIKSKLLRGISFHFGFRELRLSMEYVGKGNWGREVVRCLFFYLAPPNYRKREEEGLASPLILFQLFLAQLSLFQKVLNPSQVRVEFQYLPEANPTILLVALLLDLLQLAHLIEPLIKFVLFAL